MAHKKLVYINIDGFSFSYLERLKRKGKAGGFQRLQNDGFLFTGLRSGVGVHHESHAKCYLVRRLERKDP